MKSVEDLRDSLARERSRTVMLESGISDPQYFEKLLNQVRQTNLTLQSQTFAGSRTSRKGEHKSSAHLRQ